MKRIPVQSSNVAAVGYCPDSRTLEVEFRNKAVYQYSEVPAALHARLMASPSVGSFIHSEIKGKFRCEKVA